MTEALPAQEICPLPFIPLTSKMAPAINFPPTVLPTENITTNALIPTESEILESTTIIPTTSSSLSTESSANMSCLSPENSLVVATMNIRGQTGLDIGKQKQIEDFLKQNNIDILHCQEIEICESTFESCNFINSSYEILQNNSSMIVRCVVVVNPTVLKLFLNS